MASLVKAWFVLCPEHMAVVGPYMDATEAIMEAATMTARALTDGGSQCKYTVANGYAKFDEFEEDGPAKSLTVEEKEEIEKAQDRGLERLKTYIDRDKKRGESHDD